MTLVTESFADLVTHMEGLERRYGNDEERRHRIADELLVAAVQSLCGVERPENRMILGQRMIVAYEALAKWYA